MKDNKRAAVYGFVAGGYKTVELIPEESIAPKPENGENAFLSE